MSTATEWMTIYVKTLAGDVLAVECPLDIAPGDFPFRVYPLLSEPRPPMAFLRFIPSKELEGEEKGEEKGNPSGSFPMRFEDGDLFYLLVEDPEFVVHFRWEDDAIDPRGETIELIIMEIEDKEGNAVMTEAFYTPVVTRYEYMVDEGVDVPVRSFTDVYYHEENVEVVFNQPARVRELTGVGWRDVVVRAGATAHASPAFLAQRYFRQEYETYLSDLIGKAWERYVADATGQEALYHLPTGPQEAQEEEQEEEQEQDQEETKEEDYDY